MKILVIGGSRFVGYYMVEAALRAGHEVTMFNRGASNPGIFQDVEEIHGDRDGDLHLLNGRKWDAVVDTCGFFPRLVGASAEALKDAVDFYCFISTISVYTDYGSDGIDENTSVGTIEDETVEDIGGGAYGPLKVLCEKAVDKHFPNRAIHVRSGLIVGPRDTRNRLNYWVDRLHRGGEVLAPHAPDSLVQFIDVRDLGDWTIRMTESQISGTYNIVGPRNPITFPEVLSGIADGIGSSPNINWVDGDFLQANGVEPWNNLPLWLPGESNDFMKVSNAKAIEQGLTFRSLSDTAQSTLEWVIAHPELVGDGDQAPPERITAQQETELLEKWKQSR